MKFKKFALSMLVCLLLGVGLITFGCSQSPTNSELPGEEIEQPEKPDDNKNEGTDSDKPSVEVPPVDEPEIDMTLENAISYVTNELSQSGMIFTEDYQIVKSEILCTMTISIMDILDIDMLLDLIAGMQSDGVSIHAIDDGNNVVISILKR